MDGERWLRKSIRLRDYDYATPGAYFITVCAKDRTPIFWENVEADIIRQSPEENVAAAISRHNLPPLSAAGKITDAAIQQISEHYACVSVDKYCIMPDHIHMILRINADEYGRQVADTTVSTVVGQMKRWVSKQLGTPIWQRSFIDRVIRNEKGYLAAWEYIENNPIKMDFADDNIDFSIM